MQSFAQLPHEQQLVLLEKVAKNAIPFYNLPENASVELINLSENATYSVDDHADGRKWALRVHREGYHSYDAIRSEHAWTDALREQAGVITPVCRSWPGRPEYSVSCSRRHARQSKTCCPVRLGIRD